MTGWMCIKAAPLPFHSRGADRTFGSLRGLLLGLLICAAALAQGTTAITGGTVIDGNGGAAIADGVILINGGRITGIGPRASVAVPAGATVIDAKGKFVVPGFIDTNVHLSLYGGMRDRYESLVRYQPRQNEIVLEAAQIDLKYGITTVRDSYGMLIPLTQVRDQIARGEAVGARITGPPAILWVGVVRTPSPSASLQNAT